MNFCPNSPLELQICQSKSLLIPTTRSWLKGVKRLESNPPEMEAGVMSCFLYPAELHPEGGLVAVLPCSLPRQKAGPKALEANRVTRSCQAAISSSVPLISVCRWHKKGLAVQEGIEKQVLEHFIWNNLGLFLRAVSNPALITPSSCADRIVSPHN